MTSKSKLTKKNQVFQLTWHRWTAWGVCCCGPPATTGWRASGGKTEGTRPALAGSRWCSSSWSGWWDRAAGCWCCCSQSGTCWGILGKVGTAGMDLKTKHVSWRKCNRNNENCDRVATRYRKEKNFFLDFLNVSKWVEFRYPKCKQTGLFLM